MVTGDGRDRDAPARGAARPETSQDPGRPGRPGRPEGAGDSIGEYLARQRRLRGISIDELCERTRIPRRNIERLEAGAFDDQRDGFARGFVRTIAAALGLDADEAVMRLMREPAGGDESEARADLRELLQRLVALAVLLALAVGLWAGVSALRGSEAEPDPAPSVVYRPDVVRRLAEEVAAAPEPRAPAPHEAPSLALPAPHEAPSLALPAPPAP